MADYLRTKRALASSAGYKNADHFSRRVWAERVLIRKIEEYGGWDYSPDEEKALGEGVVPESVEEYIDDTLEDESNTIRLFWLEDSDSIRYELADVTHEQYKKFHLCGTGKGAREFRSVLDAIRRAGFQDEHMAHLTPEQKQRKADRLGISILVLELLRATFFSSVE